MLNQRSLKLLGRGSMIFAVILATFSIRPAIADQKLNYGHNQQKYFLYHAVSEYFATKVDKRIYNMPSNIFPRAKPGGKVPMMENIIAESQDMVNTVSVWSPTFVEPLGLFSVSYFLPTQNQFRRSLNDDRFNKMISDKITASGIKLNRTVTVTAGVRNWYNADVEVKLIDDVKLRLKADYIAGLRSNMNFHQVDKKVLI